MKHFLILILMACLGIGIAACSDEQKSNTNTKQTAKLNPKDIKVGFVYTGSASDMGYAYTHDQARQKMAQSLGVETIVMKNATSGEKAQIAIDRLIEQGCKVIYGISIDLINDFISAAEKYPHIYFGHATGYMQLSNLSNYMGKIYEARYLSGIVAGLNTKNNKIGYVAAMPVAEVIRGINAFALGVKSVNKDAKIELIWTGTWENPEKEKELALKLIEHGADIIAQHTDTQMPQVAAAEKGVLAIGYSGSNKDLFPKTYLTAPIFRWETFYIDDVSAIINGTWKSRAYFEGLSANIVDLDVINEALVTKDTIQKVAEAKNAIINDDFQIFTGPIYDNKGKLQVEAGKSLTKDEIFSMTYYVDNVVEILL